LTAHVIAQRIDKAVRYAEFRRYQEFVPAACEAVARWQRSRPHPRPGENGPPRGTVRRERIRVRTLRVSSE
jgi:hypothetical protein